MREVYITPQTEGKGRTFQAVCLASVEADALWDGGQTNTDDMRPVWAMFANSEQELRPFMMNLKSGRKCSIVKGQQYRRKDERMEMLRSAGYTTTWQREAEGSIATSFLPDLFHMDPGMVDVKGGTFVLLPTQEWVNAQQIELGPLVQHAREFVPTMPYEKSPALTDDQLAELVPTSFLFAAYLDRRTRCPLLADGRFYLQLMLACLKEGLASFPNGNSYQSHEFGVHGSFRFTTIGTEDVGFAKAIAFSASHSEIERVLAEQVASFFKATK
jgi:hypothetical protein